MNWTLFRSTRAQMPDQGWKIHIAASISDCPHLFAGVVPFLLASGCSFKLPASVDDAITINSGRAGRTLIGKIVTIYPGNDSEVPELVAGLDRLWQSDQAPEILTDLRVRPGSGVYIRFGAFTQQPIVQDARGVYHGALRRPDGVLVPDERRLDGVQPAWAVSPIPGAEPVQTAMQRELTLGGKRYLLLGRLQSAPKGDTFLATDTDFAATYIAKIARRGVGENATGVDCRARLKRERRFLKFLAGRGFKSPRLCAAADNAVVVEDIDGTPLQELPRNRIGGAFRSFVAAVAELHRLRVVHRDLKLSNAILAGTEVYLLDFELSAFAGATDAPSGGTRGHMSPECVGAPATLASDIFSLGASLAHAALGVDPGALAPGAGRLRALLISTGQRRIAKIVAAAMQSNPQARPGAGELATRLAELPDEWPASCETGEQPSRADAEKLKHRRARKTMETAFASAQFLASPLPRPASTARGLPADALSSGRAGIILGLAAIGFAMKRSDFDAAIFGAAEELARDVKKSPALGLFTGQAGKAFVLALVGTRYARNDLLFAGRELFTAAAHDVVELDLFFGAAGIVWSACLLASILQAQWPLRAAADAARSLTQAAKEQGGLLVWESATGAGEVKDAYLGAAHGSAGIAMSLAVWGRASGCAHSLELAHDTFLRLFQNGRTSDQRELLHKLDSEQGTNCASWCHGSAGYLWCMLQAFGDHACLRAPIDWAVRALSDVPLLASPGYCHGMAGQLDLWSMIARYPRLAEIGKPRAALAARLLEHMGLRARTAWAWPSDEPDQMRHDLWTGSLGPACALALYESGEDALLFRETLARVFAAKFHAGNGVTPSCRTPPDGMMSDRGSRAYRQKSRGAHQAPRQRPPAPA